MAVAMHHSRPLQSCSSQNLKCARDREKGEGVGWQRLDGWGMGAGAGSPLRVCVTQVFYIFLLLLFPSLVIILPAFPASVVG